MYGAKPNNQAHIIRIFENMLQLSICIPTFNRSPYLIETLYRCISEIDNGDIYSYVEILVGDNASTDNTEDICLQLEKTHQYFRYIKNKENIGAERNWLNLIKLARGRYVWILSDDDDFLPNLIADLIEIIKKENVAAIFLNYNFYNGIDKNITFGLACRTSSDYVGKGWHSFFEKTEFANSFISSNIFNRANFLKILPTIELYKGTPWFQLYVAKNIISNNYYYYYSNPKLKMRALSPEHTRGRARMGGVPHFYFDAHISFIEFLVYLDWKNSRFRRKMSVEQFNQILIERTTSEKFTGDEDYRYWFLTVKKIISIGYFNKSVSFWCRDIFLMLLPFACIKLVNQFYVGKGKAGDLLRACEGSQNRFRRLIFSFYSIWKRE